MMCKNFIPVRKFLSLVISAALLVSGVPVSAGADILDVLPQPGVRVGVSAPAEPAILKGMTVYPENPLKFNFIVDRGEEALAGDDRESEYATLVKYFLAALTVPEKDLWVNLSPYEKDRMVPEQFSYTEMARDLLAQDYLLKQLTASLMYHHQIPSQNVVPHYHWPRAGYKTPNKDCPHFLLEDGKPGATWNWFKSRVQRHYLRIQENAPPPPQLASIREGGDPAPAVPAPTTALTLAQANGPSDEQRRATNR